MKSWEKFFTMNRQKMRHILLIICLLLCLFTVQASAAGPYYIDFDVGNDSNDGLSEAEAWLTEQKAIDTAASGEIVRYVQADYADMDLTKWVTLVDTTDVNTETKDIKQWAITWTIDGYERFGRYANGDFWVYASVDINLTDITPVSTSAGRDANGSMVNLTSPFDKQGYDSSQGLYNSVYNVALDIGGGTDLVVTTESSLISTQSVATAGAVPILSDASILTVVDTVPSTGDFRPSYAGTDKTSPYNISDIPGDVYTTILQKVTPLGSAISQATAEAIVKRPWLETIVNFQGGEYHPLDHMFSYGRELAADSGDAALWLHLDKTDAEKETLLTYYLQVGIDYYGLIAGGFDWNANGGHRQGRKWPIVFAGIIFNDLNMKTPGDVFQEDQQTFYVAASDVYSFPYTRGTFNFSGEYFWGKRDNTSSRSVEYLEHASLHGGMPEWGASHQSSTLTDHLQWSVTGGYRPVNAIGWHGMILAALMTNYGEADWGKTVWDHDVIFDYQDRYVVVSGLGETHKKSTFAYDMWTEYRANYGDVWTGSYDLAAAATPTSLALDSGSYNSLTVSWSGSSAAFDVSDQTTAYLDVTSPYTITGLSPSTSYDIEVWGRKTNGIRSLVPDELTASTAASTLSFIAHYKCDENAASSAVSDSSGNNLNGNAYHITNAANQNTSNLSVTGKIDLAFEFDGTNDYVYVSDYVVWDTLSTTMSVAAWIKLPAGGLSNDGMIITKYHRNNKREWAFAVLPNLKLRLWGSDDGTLDSGHALVRNSTNAVLTLDTWHHVAFTWLGATKALVFYVDGVSVLIDAGTDEITSFYQNTAKVRIGENRGPSEEHENLFEGLIDDVRIYNTTLTAAGIRAVMQADEPHFWFDFFGPWGDGGIEDNFSSFARIIYIGEKI